MVNQIRSCATPFPGLYQGFLGKGPLPNWGKKIVDKMLKLGKKY